MHMRTKYL